MGANFLILDIARLFHFIELKYFLKLMDKNAACLLIMCYAGHENDGECHEDGREGNEERVQECQHWSNRGPSGTIVLKTLKDIDTKSLTLKVN